MTGRHTWEDLVDKFRLAHGDVDVERDERTGRIKAARSNQAPLDRYFSKRELQDDPEADSDDAMLIARDRWDSGIRLGDLWHLASSAGRVSQWKYEVTTFAQVLSHAPFNDYRRAYVRAVNAIRDPEAADIAVKVCCGHEPAGRRRNMRLLKAALDDLTRHFTGR